MEGMEYFSLPAILGLVERIMGDTGYKLKAEPHYFEC